MASACCGWLASPGKCTRATLGCCSSQVASSSAWSDWAFIRKDKVSRPFNTTQALNGDKLMPALRITGMNFSVTKTCDAHNAPATTLPWPSRYLVPECTITSAPNAIGVCKAGVQKQLSTASKAFAACAMSASARMSHTSVNGLVGVSANNKRVFGCIARCHSDTSVCETNVVCTPNLANSLLSSLWVEPNTECEHTTWSPLLSKAMHSSNTAAMPLAVPMQASAPSSAASRFSKLATVGLVKRE